MENPDGEYSTTAVYRGMKDTISKVNPHTPMVFFGVIFIIMAFITFFTLCGYQTGTCDTSGTGSMVNSCFESSDGKSNTSSEVVAEFLIMLFTLIGVGMLTYVWTLTSASKKLINEKQTAAALIINGKDVTERDLKAAEKEELMTISAKLGIPPSFIANAAATARNGMAAPGRYMSKQYNALRTGKSNKDDDDSEDQPKQKKPKSNKKRTNDDNDDDDDDDE